MLGGIVLGGIGFEPNAEQSPATLLGLRAIFALFPAVCMFLAALNMLRFRLTDQEHRRIRDALDIRPPAA